MTEEFDRFATALAGQYELEHEIGRGGMGVVYRARDLKLDRLVAIKTLPPHLAGDAVIRERFLREARTAGALSHPNIVPIHRADELGGHVFFVMGLVDGESMANRVRDQRRLDPREVVRNLRDVADALGYAHGRGVIHRDIKAENILIDRATGRALVTDFGIARLAEAAPLTSTGQMLGTVYYLSPEQISGEPVDGRSDLYSLGVAGYFALSGQFPFDAQLASAVLVAHVTKPAPALTVVAPDVPPPLASIIDRCLAKRPADRPQNGEALVEALTSVIASVDHHVRIRASRAMESPRISDNEAQAVWERAAQLQAQTGVVPRPMPTPAKRDVQRDLTRTSGYQLGDVRAAAREAGIPSTYVEHALAERGLAPVQVDRSDATKRMTEPEDRSSGGKWMGARTLIEYEIVVDGELSHSDFDLIGEVIQRATGEIGSLSEIGRALTWHSTGERRLQISVAARAGKTTIRASENLRQAAGGTFAGLMGGFGGGGGVAVFGLFASHGQPIVAAGLWAVMMGTAFVSASAIFGTVSERRQKKLREMVEAIAKQVLAAVDNES